MGHLLRRRLVIARLRRFLLHTGFELSDGALQGPIIRMTRGVPQFELLELRFGFGQLLLAR
jgi:hypothetical protein